MQLVPVLATRNSLPSVCLFPAGLDVALNDQFACETNRIVTTIAAIVAVPPFFRAFSNLTAPPCFSNVARRCFLDACPPYLEKATLLSLEKKIEWKILLNSLWIW